MWISLRDLVLFLVVAVCFVVVQRRNVVFQQPGPVRFRALVVLCPLVDVGECVVCLSLVAVIAAVVFVLVVVVVAVDSETWMMKQRLGEENGV